MTSRSVADVAFLSAEGADGVVAPRTLSQIAANADELRADPGDDIVVVNKLFLIALMYARAVVVGTPGMLPKERFVLATSDDAARQVEMFTEYLAQCKDAGMFDADMFFITKELLTEDTSATPENRMATLDPSCTWKGNPPPSKLTPEEFALAVAFLQMNPVGRTSLSNNAVTSVNPYSCVMRTGPNGERSAPQFLCPRAFVLGDTVLEILKNNSTPDMFADNDVPSWEANPGLDHGVVNGPISYHTRMTSRILPRIEADGTVSMFDIAQGDCYANPDHDQNAMWHTDTKPGEQRLVNASEGMSYSRAVELLFRSTNGTAYSKNTAHMNVITDMTSLVVYTPTRDGQATIWKGASVVRVDVPSSAFKQGSIAASVISAAIKGHGIAVKAVETYTRTLYKHLPISKNRIAKGVATSARNNFVHVSDDDLRQFVANIDPDAGPDLQIQAFSRALEARVRESVSNVTKAAGIRAYEPTKVGKSPASLAMVEADKILKDLPVEPDSPPVSAAADADYVSFYEQ